MSEKKIITSFIEPTFVPNGELIKNILLSKQDGAYYLSDEEVSNIDEKLKDIDIGAPFEISFKVKCTDTKANDLTLALTIRKSDIIVETMQCTLEYEYYESED